MQREIQAARAPWGPTGKRIESKIRKAIFDYKLLEKETKIGIALSGGKDSLTLLFMLKAISGRGCAPFTIHAFHVGGEFSCGAGIESNELRTLCNSLNVEFHEMTSKQTLDTLNCYRCSRERRSLIFDAARERGISHIAFGHHQDDHVETGLMNLLHKGEFAGTLAKIHMIDYNVTIIRPLYYVEEEEITSFAKREGFVRIVCACPVGSNSMRKKVKDLLREIEELYPNSRNNIAQGLRVYGSDKALKK